MHLHFDCVFYYVADLDAAIAFYRDILGFPFRSRDAVARFDLDGVAFELVPAEDRSRLTGTGNGRLTLRVDDLEETLSELRRKGVATGGIHVKDNGRLASLFDPDGNEMTLWEYRR